MDESVFAFQRWTLLLLGFKCQPNTNRNRIIHRLDYFWANNIAWFDCMRSRDSVD